LRSAANRSAPERDLGEVADGESGTHSRVDALHREWSRKSFLVVRLAIWAAALVGLGVLFGSSSAGERMGWLGVLLAAGVATLVLGRARLPLVVDAVVALGLGLGPVLIDPSARSVLYGLLVFVFVGLGSTLARERSNVDLREPPFHHPDAEHSLSLDAHAAKEVTRARRHERPLTVVTLRVSSRERGVTSKRSALEEVASVFSSSLRLTDAFGFFGGSRLVALLPETTAPEASVLLQRVDAVLGAELAEHVVAGIASFPEHEVTWVGLKSRACARERPLSAYGRRVLQGDLVGELERAVGEQPTASATPNPEGSGAA
jgi:hypothetical protein